MSSELRAEACTFAEPSFQVQVPSLWPYLLLCMVIAACLDLGHLHQGEHGDSIVPILVSLQRWTPFYWERDRFGMLLPLLAKPVHNPLFNLLAQEWLTSFAGLSAFFLMARYILSDKLWPAAATVVTAYFLTFVNASTRFSWFSTEQPYGSSIALAVAALLTLETESDSRWRLWPLAVLLMTLASWVNFSVSIPFILVIVLRSLLNWMLGQKNFAVRKNGLAEILATTQMSALTLLVFGVLIGSLLTRFAKDAGKTQIGTIPIQGWPNAWAQFALSSWHGLGLTTMSVIIVLIGPAVLCTIALWFVPDLRTKRHHALVVVLSVGTAGALFWLFVGTVVEVRTGLYFARYGFPSLLFLGLALAILAVTPLYRVSAKHMQNYAVPASAAVLLATSLCNYGFPSLSTARKDIDARMGIATGEILAEHANLIAGNYWLVWPAVFHANLALYERGVDQRVFGITVRGLPTRDLWSRLPLDQLRVAAFVGDNEAEKWLQFYSLPLTKTENCKHVDIFAYLPATKKNFRGDIRAY
jgi:hypothetical protein